LLRNKEIEQKFFKGKNIKEGVSSIKKNDPKQKIRPQKLDWFRKILQGKENLEGVSSYSDKLD
jgi:hypothetical protein